MSLKSSSSTKHEIYKKKPIKMVLLHFVISSFHYVRNLLIETILKWYWGNRITHCPAVSGKNKWLTKSATELAEMIRNKEIKSYDLVKAYIDRIQVINPIINAIIDGPYMEALNEAKLIDERINKNVISAEELANKPFLGVPFSTKNSICVKGKLITLGVLCRKDDRADEDAESIRLMKEAGAIILASTSVPETCRWQETRNLLIGQTNNPYDVRRTVGGSSGGESALIAACGIPFGVGSDIGGSIRMPAFYCGIFGHKPTTGIVSTKGSSLRTGDESPTMVVVGPMCRYMSDIVAMFKVLAGPRYTKELKLNEKTDVKKLKYYYIRESGDLSCNSVSTDLQNSMSRVVNHLNEIAEAPVQEVTLHGTEKSFKIWKYSMSQEPAEFEMLLGKGIKLNPFVEIGKKLIGRSSYTLASIYNLLEKYLPESNPDKMRDIIKNLDKQLEELLGDDGILLYHSTTYTAPYHYAPLINLFNFSYFGLFNCLHVPVTQVPLGLDSNSLPLGIQVVATKNRDRDCLAVASELEKVFGGWVPPFKI